MCAVLGLSSGEQVKHSRRRRRAYHKRVRVMHCPCCLDHEIFCPSPDVLVYFLCPVISAPPVLVVLFFDRRPNPCMRYYQQVPLLHTRPCNPLVPLSPLAKYRRPMDRSVENVDMAVVNVRLVHPL